MQRWPWLRHLRRNGRRTSISLQPSRSVWCFSVESAPSDPFRLSSVPSCPSDWSACWSAAANRCPPPRSQIENPYYTVVFTSILHKQDWIDLWCSWTRTQSKGWLSLLLSAKSRLVTTLYVISPVLSSSLTGVKTFPDSDRSKLVAS